MLSYESKSSSTIERIERSELYWRYLQSRGTGVKRGSKTTFPESTKQLKGHDLYIGSLLFLTKQAPSPRFRSNLYMDYNLFTGKLNIPQDIKETTQLLDDMLRGGIENIHAELLNTDDDNTDLE